MAARERYDTRDESIIVPSGERKNGGQTQKHRRTQRFTDNPVDTFFYAQKRGTSDCCKLYLYLRKESGKQAQWVLGRRGVRIEPVESACVHGLIGADWQRGGTLVGSPRLQIQQLSLFLIPPPPPTSPRDICAVYPYGPFHAFLHLRVVVLVLHISYLVTARCRLCLPVSFLTLCIQLMGYRCHSTAE